MPTPNMGFSDPAFERAAQEARRANQSAYDQEALRIAKEQAMASNPLSKAVKGGITGLMVSGGNPLGALAGAGVGMMLPSDTLSTAMQAAPAIAAMRASQRGIPAGADPAMELARATEGGTYSLTTQAPSAPLAQYGAGLDQSGLGGDLGAGVVRKRQLPDSLWIG